MEDEERGQEKKPFATDIHGEERRVFVAGRNVKKEGNEIRLKEREEVMDRRGRDDHQPVQIEDKKGTRSC